MCMTNYEPTILTSRNQQFPNSHSPKDTAKTYISYLRSHFSQQTPRLSYGIWTLARKIMAIRFPKNVFVL